jgi:hypothetical protein
MWTDSKMENARLTHARSPGLCPCSANCVTFRHLCGGCGCISAFSTEAPAGSDSSAPAVKTATYRGAVGVKTAGIRW